jgi:thiosulfate/3-mercaptopyruvate sulfurtransferase
MMKMQKVFLVVVVCFTILAASAGTGLALWGSSEVETEKISVTFASEVARGGYQIVTTERLKKMMDDKKDMLIVDTMPFEASYKKNHIPGAVPFEFPIPEMTSMDDAMKANFEKLLGPNKERTLVFYCGFTKCTRSHNGAMWAMKLGYKNVIRHPGGIKAWVEAKYPVEAAK